MEIDWTDPTAQVSKYFKVHECLWLPHWNRMATETDGLTNDIKSSLVSLCSKLDQVRESLGYPMRVHSMFRPLLYNQSLNIKPVKDVHSMGIACDFDCEPFASVPIVQSRLRDKLFDLQVRMERGTPSWVHIDTRVPGVSGREFLP